jgi:hypothetical protein
MQSLSRNTGINKLLKAVVWILYFIISFRVLSRFPMGNAEEIAFLLLILIMTGFCLYDGFSRLAAGKLNNILLMLLPLLLLPFINAWRANDVFGQPYLFGILAQRQHYLILGAWFIIIALKRNLLTWFQLEKYFLWSMYAILFIMYFFYMLIDPVVFSDTEFVKYTGYKGWIYEFPNGVTAGLLVYSAVKILLEDKLRYLIPFTVCLWFFIYYGQDRSQLVFIAATLLIMFAASVSMQKKAFYALIGIATAGMGFLLVLFLNPELIAKYITLYGSASDIFTGNSSMESSTNIRFVEAAIAGEGIRENPWLGNGYLSTRWNDGYLQFYRYFYPSDVGILGNLYVFGIIGTLIFYLPFLAVLIWAIKLRREKDPLLLTCIYGMLFFFFDMLTAASNIKFIGLPAFFFGVVYYYRYYRKPELRNF